MAYYKTKLESNSTGSASGRYGFVNVSSKEKGAIVVRGKYGKSYWIFYNKTPNGAFVGEKLFPRVAVKIVWSKDYTLHVWIKSTSKRKRKSYSPYGRGKFDYAMSKPYKNWSKKY